MVTRTRGNNPAGFLVVAEFRDAVVSTADLVGTGALQVLALEVHGHTEYLFEVARIFHRCFLSDTGEHLFGVVKVLQGWPRELGGGRRSHGVGLAVMISCATGSVRHFPAAM